MFRGNFVISLEVLRVVSKSDLHGWEASLIGSGSRGDGHHRYVTNNIHDRCRCKILTNGVGSD